MRKVVVAGICIVLSEVYDATDPRTGRTWTVPKGRLIAIQTKPAETSVVRECRMFQADSNWIITNTDIGTLTLSFGNEDGLIIE